MFTGWNSTCQGQVCGWGLSRSSDTPLSLVLCFKKTWIFLPTSSLTEIFSRGEQGQPPVPSSMSSAGSQLATRKLKPEAFVLLLIFSSEDLIYWLAGIPSIISTFHQRYRRHAEQSVSMRRQTHVQHHLWSVFLLGYLPYGMVFRSSICPCH